MIRKRPPLVLLLLLFGGAGSASAGQGQQAPDEPPRSIILFIADGAGPAHITMGRELARYLVLRDGLHLDPYQVGSVRTHSARERVTDSALSATAYATGVKTYNGAIAVDTMHRRCRR